MKQTEDKQTCQKCKKSYPETTFPPCDGENLCQNCYQYIEKLEQENKQLKEENVRLSFTRQCSSKLREDNLNLKQKLEKIEKFADISTGIVHLTLKEILESKE